MHAPGSYQVLFGTLSEALDLRRQGWALRDSLIIMTPGPLSLTVFLFRKPLEGTVAQNVLKYNLGALNIDGCRVRHSDARDLERHQQGIAATKAKVGVRDSGFNVSNFSGTNDVKLEGRWPTNLLLVHDATCVKDGMKSIQSTNGTHSTDQAHSLYGKFSHPDAGKAFGFASADGTETVPNWVCSDDCPVKQLDEQSGFLHGRANKSPTIGGGGLFGLPRILVDYGATDSGAASRFFPQFESLEGAHAWLLRLTQA